MRIIYCLVIAVVLGACNFPAAFSTPSPPTHSALPPTESSVEEVPCAWVWASRPSQELSFQLQEDLESAGLTRVAGDVSNFGEDCIDPQTNKAVRFAAMQAEFNLVVEVDELDRDGVMGELLMQIIALLENVSKDGTPGPQPDKVRVEWVKDDERIYLDFDLEVGTAALERGLTGESLLDALGYSP